MTDQREFRVVIMEGPVAQGLQDEYGPQKLGVYIQVWEPTEKFNIVSRPQIFENGSLWVEKNAPAWVRELANQIELKLNK